MRFFVPTDLRVGNGCVAAAGEAFKKLGDHCLIVTGKSAAKRSGALDDVCAVLDAQNIRWSVYDHIAQNPTVTSCAEAGQIAFQSEARFIVGIGGGSALDAAKAVAVFAANPYLSQDDLYRYAWKNAPLPVVCVGTTAGTGSEVTPVSVLTNDAGRKQSIRDDRLYPVLSLGDPRYLQSLSDYFIRSCAADAAAHCIESYFSTQHTDLSRMFAVQGTSVLAPLFRKICADGVQSLTADERQKLYLASLYGGYAISVTGTAFPHAMGYFLTENHGVPHGVACAVFLPAFLRHANATAKTAADEFAAQTGCPVEEWIMLLHDVTPPCDVHLTAEQIDALRPRFENNRGLLRSPGTVTADDALAVIRDLFAE